MPRLLPESLTLYWTDGENYVLRKNLLQKMFDMQELDIKDDYIRNELVS